MGNRVARCADIQADRISKLGAVPPNPTPFEHERSTTNSLPMEDSGVSLSTLANNPGTTDELHKKCKEVFPVCFDGAKFMVQKMLSNHFQVSHTINLSPTSTGYRFGATYVGNQMYGPQEAFPVILGDTDLSRNLNATVIHQFSERLRCKFATQIQGGKFAAAQFTGDYKFPDATASLTMANVDLVSESGVVVGSYLRAITKNISVGTELAYQYSKQMPGGQMTMLNWLGRYSSDNYIASASVGKNQLHLCYYHKQQENMQFGVEWETNFRMEDSTATFAYQLDLPKSGVVFRAMMDTHWTVGSVIEKKLAPLPFTLALSGMINHAKNQSRFGIGLILG